MKQSDLKLLAEFAGKEFWCCGIKHYNFNPDKNIADAECLLDKLSKEEYCWYLSYSRIHKKHYFYFQRSDYIGGLFSHKYKPLAICNAVLKLIKESKK